MTLGLKNGHQDACRGRWRYGIAHAMKTKRKHAKTEAAKRRVVIRLLLEGLGRASASALGRGAVLERGHARGAASWCLCHVRRMRCLPAARSDGIRSVIIQLIRVGCASLLPVQATKEIPPPLRR